MIRNYLVIALRNLWRNKLITAINLLGMAMGFGIFLMFWTWVSFDFSFDKMHEDFKKMYMLNVRLTTESGSEYTSERTGGVFSTLLADQIPEVEASCRVSSPFQFELGIPLSDSSSGIPMKYFDEEEVLMVDSNFFAFYSFPLIEGQRVGLFQEKTHLVITRELASILFGDEEALGRQVRIGEGGYFTVAAVAEDPPENSTFQFRALLGFHILEEMGYPVDGFGGTMYYNNFKLAEGADLDKINGTINQLVEEREDLDFISYFFLDPFKRVHLHGETRGIIGFYTNLIMSLLILGIACINFINLTSAVYSTRLKEITIRKSNGASKRQLVYQFMGETYLVLLLAFYLGLFIAEQLVPAVSRSFRVDFDFNSGGWRFWLFMLLLYLFTGMLAGLYPAIKISGFKPNIFLTNKSFDSYRGGRRSRKILILVQLTFSVVFIVVSLLMIRQYNYLQEADLGFNREEVIYTRTKGHLWERYPLLKEQLGSLHFISGVTSGSEIPVMINRGEVDWGERESEKNVLACLIRTDADFISTFEISMKEGTYFIPGQDSLNRKYVVVNQNLVDLMEWDDPVGRTFYLMGHDYTILGVTDNIDFFPFNLEIFKEKALIYMYEDVSNFIFIRIAPGTHRQELSAIEGVFSENNPGYVFEYDYVSEYEYEAMESADGLRLVFNLFSAIAVFIALMGMIGLSLHDSSRRTKEVGIRKAMGAQTGTIMQLLLSDFLKLVILSNLIALPISYLVVRRILQFFSYSIDLRISTFLLVLGISLIISLATVSIHAWRTARSNPVNSLRYE
jgi:ABC-type antimicrobial peptide transport system permease subunit